MKKVILMCNNSNDNIIIIKYIILMCINVCIIIIGW